MRAVSEEGEEKKERAKKKRYESEHQLKTLTYHLLSMLTAKIK